MALNWHKKTTGWEAWAPKILLKDSFPPRYRLELLQARSTERRVVLARHGFNMPTTVGVAANLEEAKAMAEDDYAARQLAE